MRVTLKATFTGPPAGNAIAEQFRAGLFGRPKEPNAPCAKLNHNMNSHTSNPDITATTKVVRFPQRSVRGLSLRSASSLAHALVCLLLLLVGSRGAETAPTPRPPLKVLFFSGGGYHDYAKLTPHLTGKISQLANVSFEVKSGLDALRDPKFAVGYDAVVYDVCFDEAPDEVLENAIQTARNGEPTVMIHCAVHAFRRSPKIHEWETCCGMRSKVHDAFGAFTVTKADPTNPITKSFPNDWRTPGDELYQTISIDPQSHPLLKAKSPQDGREHVVCWTYQFGRGRVFATTLGHDMQTASSPDYLRLVANGLLWACGKLDSEGHPAAGYSGPEGKGVENRSSEAK